MHSPQLNWLLALLPQSDYDKLLPHLELVGLESGKVLFQAGQQDTALYFPTTCTISAQIELENGITTDIYTLGKQCIFGAGNTNRGLFFRAIVRQPGFAYRCAHSVYMRELMRSEGLVKITLIATRIMMEEMAIGIACRTFHNVDQQVASWLLSYGQDASPEDIPITHAELANALGARRERVTLALNEAARQGLVSLHRGHITVNDYSGLRQFACNCYAGPTLNKALRHRQELQDLEWMPKFLKPQPA